MYVQSLYSNQCANKTQKLSNNGSILPFNRRNLISASLFKTIFAAGAAMTNKAMASSDPQSLVRSGMRKFQAADVKGSLLDFDEALKLGGVRLRPYLWQRGISLYYLDSFQEGAKQFRDDVAVNPSDTEESIWAFLCEAQLYGPDKARQDILKVGRDPRSVMRAAQAAFEQGLGSAAIAAVAGNETQGHAAFYSQLYVALYEESIGNEAKAKEAMLRAAATEYAKTSGDYMAGVARVHCTVRNWT